MKNKKAVKQLMALGIQRNEAAVFARVYGKVKAARREDLFPEIILPAMPVRVVRREMEIVTLQADCRYEPSLRMEDSVKSRLASELAKEAVRRQLVEFTRRTEDSSPGPLVVTRAQIKIVKPE